MPRFDMNIRPLLYGSNSRTFEGDKFGSSLSEVQFWTEQFLKQFLKTGGTSCFLSCKLVQYCDKPGVNESLMAGFEMARKKQRKRV